jgi:hypothetical protein
MAVGKFVLKDKQIAKVTRTFVKNYFDYRVFEIFGQKVERCYGGLECLLYALKSSYERKIKEGADKDAWRQKEIMDTFPNEQVIKYFRSMVGKPVAKCKGRDHASVPDIVEK